jgi:PQQ enzyme repeat
MSFAKRAKANCKSMRARQPNSSRARAYDAATGKVLWSFFAGAGVNAPPASYAIDGKQWQCQTNANQTAKCAKRIASGCQLTPLGQRGGAVLLEDVASAEVAIVVKVIVDRGVDGGEFLQGLEVPEFRHCPFPSSERLV